MIYRTLASFAALLLLAFPKANAQTTVTGHHLENTSVGFYGFGVNIPYNYYPYTPPPSEKNFKVVTYADLAWVSTAHLDKHAGFTTIERLPFQSTTNGLVVSVLRGTERIPSIKDKIEYLRFLDKFMSWTVEHSDKEIMRDTRQIGDIYVGRVASAYGNDIIAANIVLIPPRTVLAFHGTCSKEKKDDLLQDLDAIIATLDIGKRTPPAP